MVTNDNDNNNDFRYAMLRYELALDKVLNAINGLKRELELDPDAPKIDRVESRIKTDVSIKDKCQKKGVPFTIENVEQTIHDVAGVRIVTYFRHEIYEIADKLLAIPGINFVKVKDYIENPKPSGYRGYHLIVSIEVYSRGRSSIVTLEIQIRDLLMDAWSKIEHRKRYKPHGDDPSDSLNASFTKYADVLDRFDLEVDASNLQPKDFGIPENGKPCVAAFQGVIVVDEEEEGPEESDPDEYHKPINM